MPVKSFWSSPKRRGPTKRLYKIRIVHLLPIILIVLVTPQVLSSNWFFLVFLCLMMIGICSMEIIITYILDIYYTICNYFTY